MSPRKRGNRQGEVRKRGGSWRIRFTDRVGNRIERTTDAKTKDEALRLLNRQLDDIWGRKGTVQRVTVADLLPLIVADYERKGQDTAVIYQRWKALGPAFATLLVSEVTTDALSAFVVERNREASPATVNRELACLRRMFRLAMASTPRRVGEMPIFPMQREDNARTGFFEQREYLELHDHLPDYLRPLLTLAYYTGCRLGELRQLEWSQVDLQSGEIRLRGAQTKTRKGRVIFVAGDALAELVEWRRSTRSVEIETGSVIPTVFHRGGQPLGRFYKAWATACRAAGLEGKLFHDLRRTAARNMVRAGVSEHTAMAVTGHKTRSVFDRYDIVSEDDLRSAAQAVSRPQRGPNAERKATKEGGSRRRK